MEQYGIDGAFVQRFAGETVQPKDLRHVNAVLSHCREGANRSRRAYAVMYDLSGLPAGGTKRVIDDWKLLVDRMKIGRDPKDAAYLRGGKGRQARPRRDRSVGGNAGARKAPALTGNAVKDFSPTFSGLNGRFCQPRP
jgi:hypothetical protein